MELNQIGVVPVARPYHDVTIPENTSKYVAFIPKDSPSDLFVGPPKSAIMEHLELIIVLSAVVVLLLCTLIVYLAYRKYKNIRAQRKLMSVSPEKTAN
jgi:hypothetical protein